MIKDEATAAATPTRPQDFFYEPAQCLMEKPSDFGRGVMKGSSSLVTHLSGGIFGAASSITGRPASEELFFLLIGGGATSERGRANERIDRKSAV